MKKKSIDTQVNFDTVINERFKDEIKEFQKTFLACTDLNADQKEELQDCVNSFIDEFDFNINASDIACDPNLMKSIYDQTIDYTERINDQILDNCRSVLEKHGPYKVIKCESLAEVMKVEQFMCELTENPYQLNLI